MPVNLLVVSRLLFDLRILMLPQRPPRTALHFDAGPMAGAIRLRYADAWCNTADNVSCLDTADIVGL